MSYQKLIKLAARFSNKYAMNEELQNLEDKYPEYTEAVNRIIHDLKDIYSESKEAITSNEEKLKKEAYELLGNNKWSEEDVLEYLSYFEEVQPNLDDETANIAMGEIIAKYDDRRDRAPMHL